MEHETLEEWQSEVESQAGWLKKIANLWGMRLSRAFILHHNIDDILIYEKMPGPLKLLPFLFDFFQNQCSNMTIIKYSLSTGIVFPANVDIKQLKKHFPDCEALLEKKTQGEFRTELDRLISELALLERFLYFTPKPEEENSLSFLIIIEHLDHLVPAVAQAAALSPANLAYLETFQRWASSPEIKNTDNLILGISKELASVNPALYSANDLWEPVAIPVPGGTERGFFIDYLENINELEEEVRPELPLTKLAEDIDKNFLVKNTNGLSLIDLQELNRLAFVSDEKRISKGVLKERKKIEIENKSGGILSVQDTKHGFDCIGGLKKASDYFIRISEKLGNGNPACPKGILLSGPPGTGKTILAEAMASQAGATLVQMGNIRNKFIGESERQLDTVLSVISDLNPVIVFVDEIDQSIGGRPDSSNDSGVNQRIFGKILNFMGKDENRGKILWVGATNRPDRIDDAMLRRFDVNIPVTLPYNPEDRKKIFLSIEKKLGISFETDLNWDTVLENTGGLSGANIETLLQWIIESSPEGSSISNTTIQEALLNFKTNSNREMYDLQTLLAINACNFFNFLPAKEDVRKFFPDSLKECLLPLFPPERNPGPMLQKIDEFKLRYR